MDVMLGFISQYISAAELVGKQPITMTIGKVALEKVASMKIGDDEGNGKEKDRVIIYFENSKSGRGWLLNRTNAECIKELWGRETDAWIGKRITLHAQNVRVGPKMEPGIRVLGTPEITEARSFVLKLPRKKPIPMTLLPTGKPKVPAADPAPEPADATP